MACPDADSLQAVIDGTASAEERRAVVAHAEGCPDCRALLGALLGSGGDSDTWVDSGAPARTREVARGTRIGRYVVRDVIGGGAMGVVYAAHDPELDRRVALKLLRLDPLDVGSGSERRVRMQREAQSLARVPHPHVISVYDVGSWEGQVFIAMELVEGANLRAWLAERPRGWLEVLGVFLAAGRGLAAAHAAQVVHRDFKPDNVLVGRDGAVRVTDFGLARRVGEAAPVSIGEEETLDTELTRTGALLGTPAYMSPEQLAGQPIDAASDQFSFCVALWEALFGERPFAGEDHRALERAVRAGQRREPPREVAARVPAPLRRAVERGLDPSPAARWPLMNALIGELERVARPPRRRALWAAAIAAGLVAGVAAAVVLVRPTATPAVATARAGIAVLPFANLGKRDELGWLATALPEMLTSELAAGERLRTVPPATAARAATAPRPDEKLTVRYLVTGSFVKSGDRLRVDLRLEEPGGEGVVTAFGETAREEELVDLVSRAGARLRGRLGVPELSRDQAARARTTLPANAEAARLYAEAQERLRAGDEPAALPLLEQAVAADPRFAVAHATLAGTLWDLGHGDRARVAAGRARELAAGLAREDQLVIEARAAQAVNDSAAAADTYQLLYRFFPDRHDYGLELLAAQFGAGRNAEAEKTLAALRAAGPPVADDVELDRADIALANHANDVGRALAAAARVTQRGRDEGVPYLVADGLFTVGEAALFRGEVGRAASAFEELRALQRTLDNPRGEMSAALRLGLVRNTQGRLAEATALLEEARAVSEKSGDDKNRWLHPVRLAELAAETGRLAEAEALLAEARGHEDATAGMTAHAIVALHRGELDAALERVEAMIRKWEGRPFYESRGVALRGRIRAARGDLEGARRDYLEALALQDRLGFEVAAARSRLGLAEVELAAGDLGRVDELVRAALPPIARELLAPDLAQAAALAALSTHRRGGRASTAELHRLAAAVESWPLRQQILLGAAEIEGDAAAAQELRRRAAAAGFVRLGR